MSFISGQLTAAVLGSDLRDIVKSTGLPSLKVLAIPEAASGGGLAASFQELGGNEL